MEYEIKITTHYPGPDEVPEETIKDTLEYVRKTAEKCTRLLTRALMLYQCGDSKGMEIILDLVNTLNRVSKDVDRAGEEYHKKVKEG